MTNNNSNSWSSLIRSGVSKATGHPVGRVALWTGAAVATLYSLLYFLQHKLLYMGRSYHDYGLGNYYRNQRSSFTQDHALREVPYHVPGLGPQTAYWAPPKDEDDERSDVRGLLQYRISKYQSHRS
jgi:hypothetical protein